MELTYHGANCFKVVTKNANIVVDDNLADLGAKSIVKPGDIVLSTNHQQDGNKDAKILIDSAGEYEVSDVSIIGVAVRAHMGEEKTKTATMYKIMINDVSLAFTGHVFPDLSDDEIEELGHVDVLVVPVGGNGYTMDGVSALKVVKKIEPKLVIPSHYADKSIKYEVAQEDLTEGLKGLSMEPAEKVQKLKIKHSDIPENLQLVVIEK